MRDVDLDLGEVRITGSAAVIAGQRVEGTTKSSRSRTVSIDARLHDLRHVQATTLMLAGVPAHVVAAGWATPTP